MHIKHSQKSKIPVIVQLHSISPAMRPPAHAHKHFWASSSTVLFYAPKEVTLGKSHLLQDPFAFPSCTSSVTVWFVLSFEEVK